MEEFYFLELLPDISVLLLASYKQFSKKVFIQHKQQSVIANTFLVIRKKQTGLSSYLNLENRPLVVLVFEADFLSTVFEGRSLRAIVKSRGELLCYVHGEIPSHISTFFLTWFFFFFKHLRGVRLDDITVWVGTLR